MRDIFISAGHSNGKGQSLDRGAVGNGYIEGDLSIELRNLIVNELKNYNVKVYFDDDRNALIQTLQWLKSLISSKSIMIDLHWNAGGGTGVEVIIPDQSSPFERSLAQALADRISSLTGLKKRSGGVKPESATPRKRLGWMRPQAENVLIEMCFIDSKVDMAAYQANKISLVKGIALILKEFSNI